MECLELQEQFAEDLTAACLESVKVCGYFPGEVFGRARNIGAVETAKRMLREHAPGYYFRLLSQRQRLDLSVEAHVVKPEYRELFTPRELEVAETRLHPPLGGHALHSPYPQATAHGHDPHGPAIAAGRRTSSFWADTCP